MAGEGEDAVYRDYTFTVQFSDVPREYQEKVKEALRLVKVVACGEISENTYDTNGITFNEAQEAAVKEFDEFLNDNTHYIRSIDLAELDLVFAPGVEFETDRLDFVWGTYKVEGYQEPYWVIKRIK